MGTLTGKTAVVTGSTSGIVLAIARTFAGAGANVVLNGFGAPADIEKAFGITSGHIYHGELALHQIFFLRPMPGWAQYKTPIENLWM